MPNIGKLWVKPIFLLGPRAAFVRADGLGFAETDDHAVQDARTNEILAGLGIDATTKTLIRSDDDFRGLETDYDVALVFVHTMHRFGWLREMAMAGTPIILAAEGGAPGDALDAFEPIAGYAGVTVAYGPEEIRRRLTVLQTAKWVKRAKICLFDRGERSLDASSWYANPLIQGELNVERVQTDQFKKALAEVPQKTADDLAGEWLSVSELQGPDHGDVVESARLFVAMKSVIDDMNGDAAYVLWCGQFSDMIGGKMCFAVAKLNDAGCLTGCWRGENMLPMMILFGLTERPVFFGEMHMYDDGILSLRHCAVPTRLVEAAPVLKRWRDRQGTVTGYCRLPRGEVTVVNSGRGDNLVALKGELFDTKDIGGDNCRTTVFIRLADSGTAGAFCGREFAMAYGDYVRDVADVGKLLGCRVTH
jgi:hypothetical protein